MPAADSGRKLASLAIIGALIGASTWLRPSPEPELLPARPLRPIASPPGVRSGSESVRIGVRSGSEYEYKATQVEGTSEASELRTAVLDAGLAPLAARSLTFSVAVAPVLGRPTHDDDSRNSVGRALAVAGRETGDAFRTAGRVLRSIF